MKPSTPTQLKDWIKNLSKEKDISANIIILEIVYTMQQNLELKDSANQLHKKLQILE